MAYTVQQIKTMIIKEIQETLGTTPEKASDAQFY